MSSTDTSGLRARIRELREARGLSQRQLGRLAGVAHSTVQRIEGGSIDPLIVTLDAIATVLGCTGSYRLTALDTLQQ